MREKQRKNCIVVENFAKEKVQEYRKWEANPPPSTHTHTHTHIVVELLLSNGYCKFIEAVAVQCF